VSTLTRWQELKNEWAAAMDQHKPVTIKINVLYAPDDSQQPAGLDVQYAIDGETFTRTFRGIPEGYDATRQPA
jgi:hypothetical protein